VTTFHACSSPAPTPVKLQPAPAILSQESVHTTLSITHHIRKRPSTGPRTTHGPQEAAGGGGRRHQAAAAAGMALPARMPGLPSNPLLWRLWWRVVVACLCTTGRPVAWGGELAVGGHGGAVAACGAGRRGRMREAAWLR
jgi:hypothetical protein